MSGDSSWRCRSCGTVWTADFTQLVCWSCGDEKVVLDEQERLHPRQQNICFGDIIVSGFTPQPQVNVKTLER